MDKKEFEQKKELIEFEKQAKLEVLKYVRDTERLKHEMNLERERIKSAEIRKAQMRAKDKWMENQ